MTNPETDHTHVDDADLAVQPETVFDRIRHYNKAIASGFVGAVSLGALVITGADVDPAVAVSLETLIGTALVLGIRNR